jgi:hypothetical protein
MERHYVPVEFDTSTHHCFETAVKGILLRPDGIKSLTVLALSYIISKTAKWR